MGQVRLQAKHSHAVVPASHFGDQGSYPILVSQRDSIVDTACSICGPEAGGSQVESGARRSALQEVIANFEPRTAGLWFVESISFFLILIFIPVLIPTARSLVGPSPYDAQTAAALTLSLGLTAFAIGLYRPVILRHIRAFALNAAVAVVVALPLSVLVCVLLRPGFGNDVSAHGAFIAMAMAAWLLSLSATRTAYGAALRLGWFQRRVVLVGDDIQAALLRQACADAFIVSHATPHAPPTLAELRASKTWALIAGDATNGCMTPTQARYYMDGGMRLMTREAFFERHLKRIDLATVRDDAAVFADDASIGARLHGAVHRGFDIVMSLGLLLFTLPLMLVATLAIRLTSPGPALYRQERVGLGGKTFMLLKFRSMRIDAEAGGKPVWASQRDPRVTPVGQFIRRVRIDELPQLINVLRGDMSFIGPRPERPYFANQLAQVIPGYASRHAVKPGISGWAQINYPYGASVEDARMKLSYDLYYVKQRSLLLDLQIVIATVRVILLQEGSR